MYIKFENREQGKRFTFFPREREINGKKCNHTDKSVFGNVSEAIKVGEVNGQPQYEYDSWDARFCGKAYEKARNLVSKDKICVVEMNIRNVYHKESKKNYPQIMITDFDVIGETGVAGNGNSGDEFLPIPDGVDEETPFN